MRFFANTAYVAVLIQTGWQLWRLRSDAPVPAALAAACLFAAVGSSLRLAGWDMPEEEEAS